MRLPPVHPRPLSPLPCLIFKYALWAASDYPLATAGRIPNRTYKTRGGRRQRLLRQSRGRQQGYKGRLWTGRLDHALVLLPGGQAEVVVPLVLEQPLVHPGRVHVVVFNRFP